jgi:quinol monooxygenase YgiN
MAFHLAGAIVVPPADIEQVRAALPEHIRLTRAEPGCRSFTVTEREGGRFDVAEEFADRAAFEAHQARAAGTLWAQVSKSAARDYKTWET